MGTHKESLNEAAPDLLNALRGALAWLDPDKTTSYNGSIDDWAKEARDAIKKAEGG